MNDAGRAALAFILTLAALPTAMLGLLITFGQLHPLPALLGWGLCLAVALGFGALLARDISILETLMKQLRARPEDHPEPVTLLVPGMRGLGSQAVQMVREAQLGRALVRQSSAADRALVERLPDPLLKLDATGNVLWRNASADAAFGHETTALLRHPDVRAALAEATAQKAPVRREFAMAAPAPRHLEVTVIPVGGPVYVLINDRTRERSVDKMRADFVANASHELRTPLASLIGFIETLRGPAADDADAQQRFLGIMDEQAQRMQRVIADLLSLSRIETSEHVPPDTMLFLPPLLERITAALEPMLAASHTRIDLNVPADLPMVAADADQITQLFTNLLDNAIKYGKTDGRIKFSAMQAGGDPRFEPNGVLISVADDGAGIERAHIPRLTERFYRIDKGRSRSVGGTGLGLAIVKHVVNRHRGRLVIDSVQGQGSVFTVWLPLKR